MFSRAAKSFVKSLGQRKYHAGEESLKVTVAGAAGEIRQTLSQLVKQTSKIDYLTLYDAIPHAKLSHPSRIRCKVLTFQGGKQLCDVVNNSRVVILAAERTRSPGILRSLVVKRENGYLYGGGEEKAGSLSSCFESRELVSSKNLQLTEGKTSGNCHDIAVNPQASPNKTLWMGEPDCGESGPDRKKKGPCHPPEGPCTPLPPPGYPSRPKPEKKPFCVKCPPKKPCNPRTCESETEGTWRPDDERSILKLSSQPQAATSVWASRAYGQAASFGWGAPRSHGSVSLTATMTVGTARLTVSQEIRQLLTRDQRRYLSSKGGGDGCGKKPKAPRCPPPKTAGEARSPCPSSKPCPTSRTVAPGPCPIQAKPPPKVCKADPPCGEVPSPPCKPSAPSPCESPCKVAPSPCKPPPCKPSPPLYESSCKRASDPCKPASSPCESPCKTASPTPPAETIPPCKPPPCKILKSPRPCKPPTSPSTPCSPRSTSTPRTSPCGQARPVTPKCPENRPASPPPYPRPCPPPPPEPAKPKICFRKCPPPPKLPKLPKCPKIPAPPKPPPLPKLPKRAKCPPPCPPPKPPKPPKCPKCPPMPPPCPPCPPPPPCHPPPPPPCPPCPQLKSRPKPSPTCCPQGSTHEKPESSCKKNATPRQPECPEEAISCAKSSKKSRKGKGKGKCKRKGKGKWRWMSTYHRPCIPVRGSLKGSLVDPFVNQSISKTTKQTRRSFLTSATSWSSSPSFSSSSSDQPPPRNCKSSQQLCGKSSSDDKKSCTTSSRSKEHDPCQAQKRKCIDPSNLKRKKISEGLKCSTSCLPRDKCANIGINPPQAEAMEYRPPVCPLPKFVAPQPCPLTSRTAAEAEAAAYPEHRTKEIVCPPPPPLPKPPCGPVALCPCPPPPKLHPGSCPRYEAPPKQQREPIIPCPSKAKYPCPADPYCPPDPSKVKCDGKMKKDCKSKKDKGKKNF